MVGCLPAGGTALGGVQHLAAKALAVHKQFYAVGVGASAEVNQLPFVEVPVGEQVYHWVRFGVEPRGLHNVVGVLREACRVNRAEIAAARVVRCRLADVIPPGPKVLPQRERPALLALQADIPALRAPTCAAVAQA